jgi:hypothetical protein
MDFNMNRVKYPLKAADKNMNTLKENKMQATRTISHLEYGPNKPFTPVTIRTDRSKLMSFGHAMLTDLRFREALKPLPELMNMALQIPEGNIDLTFKDTQFEQLRAFLDTGSAPRFYAESFGDPQSAQKILAFSYGAKLPVNRALAARILEVVSGKGPGRIYAQWEIADQLAPYSFGLNAQLHVTRIGIRASESDGDSGYIVKDKKKLENSKLIPGLSARFGNARVCSLINKALHDPATNEDWDDMPRTEADLDDPLAAAWFQLKTKIDQYREDNKKRNYDRSPHFEQLVEQLSLTRLMMLAPKGSMDFYITSKGVIDQYKREEFLDETGTNPMGDKPPVFVVAQSWHAPRLLQLCKAMGINVVGGSFVDMFSENDSQIWVTNPFSWLVKEAGVWAGRPELFPA